jgi:hypothetical protein
MRKPFGLYHYHVVRDCLETTYPTVTANHGFAGFKDDSVRDDG